MIHGHKPAGYFRTFDPTGRKVEGESRQCIHCQYHWEYRPGSGIRRGFCLKCDGWLCGRAVCDWEQAQRRAEYVGYDCMPYDDWVNRTRDRYARDARWNVLPSGIVVQVDPSASLLDTSVNRIIQVSV